jgi:hypothetical protein
MHFGAKPAFLAFGHELEFADVATGEQIRVRLGRWRDEEVSQDGY